MGAVRGWTVVARRVALRGDHQLENGDRRNGVMAVDRCNGRHGREELRVERHEEEGRSPRREDGLVVDGGWHWKDGYEQTLKEGLKVVRTVGDLRGQSGPGMLVHLVEVAHCHFDSWVQKERSWDYLTIWLALNHCARPLLQVVVILVDEVVEGNVGGTHDAEILLRTESGDGVAAIAPCKLEYYHKHFDVIPQG